MNSNSTLPVKLNVQYLTEKRLSSFDFSEDDIMKVIQKLDLNKAHGQDNISIRIIKICGKSICKPLRKTYEECLRTDTFTLEWKKGNIVPIFKKGDEQIYKNYRPVSLLPIFGKIIERLIFEEMFPFFIENKLMTANKSGFKCGDSCINQFIAPFPLLTKYNNLFIGLRSSRCFLKYSQSL